MRKLSAFWLYCLLVSLFAVTTNVAADDSKQSEHSSKEKNTLKQKFIE